MPEIESQISMATEDPQSHTIIDLDSSLDSPEKISDECKAINHAMAKSCHML